MKPLNFHTFAVNLFMVYKSSDGNSSSMKLMVLCFVEPTDSHPGTGVPGTGVPGIGVPGTGVSQGRGCPRDRCVPGTGVSQGPVCPRDQCFPVKQMSQ